MSDGAAKTRRGASGAALLAEVAKRIVQEGQMRDNSTSKRRSAAPLAISLARFAATSAFVFRREAPQPRPRGVYHLRGVIAPRGADLLYYSPLDIKSDSKESTNRALFSKD